MVKCLPWWNDKNINWTNKAFGTVATTASVFKIKIIQQYFIPSNNLAFAIQISIQRSKWLLLKLNTSLSRGIVSCPLVITKHVNFCNALLYFWYFCFCFFAGGSGTFLHVSQFLRSSLNPHFEVDSRHLVRPHFPTLVEWIRLLEPLLCFVPWKRNLLVSVQSHVQRHSTDRSKACFSAVNAHLDLIKGREICEGYINADKRQQSIVIISKYTQRTGGHTDMLFQTEVTEQTRSITWWW